MMFYDTELIMKQIEYMKIYTYITVLNSGAMILHMDLDREVVGLNPTMGSHEFL